MTEDERRHMEAVAALKAGKPRPERKKRKAVDLTEARIRLSLSPAAKLGRFAKALARWTQAGFPVRPAELQQQIYARFCERCPENKGDFCQLCGCLVKSPGPGVPVVSKILLATESCPLELWGAST